MNLIACYNVWSDSVEHLEFSIKSIRESVDSVLVVVSRMSNTGLVDTFALDVCHKLKNDGLIDHLVIHEPYPQNGRFINEVRKRKKGIDYARELGFSHFILMDSDEYYIKEEFEAAKYRIKYEDIDATVVRLQTYFAKPTLRLEKQESYYVPFIHRMNDYTVNGRGDYRWWVDPTRRIKVKKRAILLEGIDMHHYSYIRNDIMLKLENSTAEKILNSSLEITEDLLNAKDGMYCRIYDSKLVECENIFKIDIEKWKRTNAKV